jgi:hypothetical protein
MSKIYKIESLLCPDIFIGSTKKKYLSERMTYYRYEYKKYLLCKSDDEKYNHFCDMKIEYGHESLLELFKLFDTYNIKNFKINLIIELPLNSNDYMKSKIFDYVKNNNNCINNKIV